MPLFLGVLLMKRSDLHDVNIGSKNNFDVQLV